MVGARIWCAVIHARGLVIAGIQKGPDVYHPVSSITDDEVLQRVAQVRVQAQEVWLGTKAPLPIRVDLN